MRFGYWFVPLALLVMSAPAQEDEGRVYFSLNSDHHVRAGESIPVRVQAQGIRNLDFRLYRVNDPIKFFRQLDQPHRFGGSIRPTPKARTPIEKFAAWKHRWHARARDVIRQQFSADNRHVIRASMLKEPAPAEKKAEGKKGEEFAGVSVLNPQQLVRSWNQPIQTPDRWEAATVPVELKEKGLYVLEATNGKLQAYTILSVTDMALITKTTPGRLMIRAVDRVTGAPLPNVPVQVYDSETKQDFARSATDPDGLLNLEVKDISDEGAVVLARHDKDFAVVTVSGYTLSSERSRNFMGYVYTDRPVYRPGHPVHFKAIVRNMAGADYKLPDQSSVQVQVEDAEGKTILKKKASLSRYGSVSGDLTLPADAAIGYYSINVSLGGEEREMKAYGGFHVEEYRKPEYEVKVTTESPRVIQGGHVKMNVDVKYYYGEPVAGASVKYTVHRYRYWAPWYEPEDDMGGDEEDGGGYGGEQISEETAKLDSQGHLTIDVPTTTNPYDNTYRLEARVTDSSNREVAGFGTVVATRGSFFITAAPERYVYGPGDPARMMLETRDYTGVMIPNVAFRLEVAPRKKEGEVGSAVLTLEGRTGADGKGRVDFPAPASGSYQVKVTAADTSGRPIGDNSWLWISGEWSESGGTSEERIQIIPDKKSYKAGDKATLLLITNVPEADVWLSLEGKTLYWSKFIHAKGGTATVEIPIESAHAPNVFVDATFISNNTLYRGSKSLKVPPVEKQIQVEVQSSKNEYKPGEPAQFTVIAKDHQGKPVNAEFSLGVVDEAIYAVKKEAQPDILNVFYGRTWNRVGTDTSMEYYFYGEAGKRRMQLAQIRGGKSRAQLKPDKLVEPKIRKNFPDTAYWIADLKTGNDGRAQTEVTFPDSLTTWRTTARGVTEDTRVGGAIQRTIVRKNLMVTMATPRFFTEGDEVTVPVLVRNYTAGELKVKVSLDAQGVQVLSGGTSEVTVAAKGEGRVDYRIRANAVDKVVLTAKALTTQESDALELTFPVEPYGLKLIAPQQTKLEQKSQGYTFTNEIPQDAQGNWRSVTVHLTPSAAGAVFGALEYLITYPYGCTEQTMSSFLPNVVVSQALKDLKLPANIDQKDLAKKVKAGLERLYDYQHEDGCWGWWKDDESDPFMTAYVTTGLKQAADAGYSIELWRIQNAAQSLSRMLDGKAKIAPDTRAYMVYALAYAGHQSKPQVERVWNERNEFTNFGLALLGLTFDRLKDGRAADVATQLTAKISKTNDGSYWASDRDPMLDFESDNSLEATAFAVKFLSKQQPTNPLIDEATQWLVNHRDQGYYWSSTKRTAFVIFGLTDVLKRSGELKPNYRVRVTMNGAEVFAKSFSADDALSPQPVKIRLPLKGSDSHPKIAVEKSGDGVLYASARWEYRWSGAEGRSKGETSLKINRNYYRLTPVNDGGRVIYNMEPLTGEAKLGDLVAVRLSVTGQPDQRYLLVEDPLPTGAEVVARDDLYQLRSQPPWWTTWWTRREVRDNRVSYFPWSMPKNGLEYVYLIRFTNAGAFKVAPARVEPMYKPGHLGWSQPVTFEVHP